MGKHAWPADDVLIEGIVAAGGVQQYARSIDVASATLRHQLTRQKIYDVVRARLDVRAAITEAKGIASQVSKAKTGEQKPSVTVKGDTATIVSRPAPKIGDPQEWIAESGLDPEEWEAYNIKLNTWDAMTSDKATGDNQIVKMFQVTASARRKVKLDWLFPAADVKQRPAPKPCIEGSKQTILLVPDQHFPYVSREAEKRLFEMMHDVQPDRIVNLGDICDYPSISKYKDNPAYFATVRECTQTAFEHIAAQRDICPDATIDLIEGNHDARPRNELLLRAERAYDLRPADIPGEAPSDSPWSLKTLLHLDRLNVNFVGPPLEGDGYQYGLLEINEDLAACHGWLTGTSSASGTMERLGMSVFFGHTHHQRVHEKLVYKGSVPVSKRFGIECGTLRTVPGGGGFAMNPDWQVGAATATLWPDGRFSYDMARLDLDGRLYWRDRRY